MTPAPSLVQLLVFEAADCLMAVVASEVGHLEKEGREKVSPSAPAHPSRPRFDLGEYFIGHESDGPWLQWARGTRSAWLRVRRVVDVMPVSLASLAPLPSLLRSHTRTRAFLAAGVRDDQMFLVLDPARLTS